MAASTSVLTPDEFEGRLRDYLLERGEESRAVRVGLKETSEQAAIVARYSHLFTREQLDTLRAAHDAATESEERERLYRLHHACQSVLITARLAPLHDRLQNEEIAARVELDGESLPFRTASARLGATADYAEREELGRRTWDVSAELNEQRAELAQTREELRAELSGELDPIRRSDVEKQISLRELAETLAAASYTVADAFRELSAAWLDRLLGPRRERQPAAYHAPYAYRLSSLARVYAKDRATEVCLATLTAIGLDLERSPNIHTDLEDRPQKAPRPVVIPADPPTRVYLITRPQGGLLDYQAFLHEAGHAFHFAGSDPALPYTFRRLARDQALTEVYSYLLQAITREAGWHAEHFGLSPSEAGENAEATRFLDAYMFRRNVAKLNFELDFWDRFREQGPTSAGYAERLTEATGFVYRADRYLADMDFDFYSADYLRAAIRSAQVRARLRDDIGGDWWKRPETGDYLRTLFREGVRPSSEEIAGRVGFEPLDVTPLVAELTASRDVVARSRARSARGR